MRQDNSTQTRGVLLHVEDDDGDAFLTNRAFRQLDKSIDLIRVTSGQDAWHFIEKIGPYSDAPNIRGLLLDLQMPNGDGNWLLGRLAEREPKFTVPTIIFSGDSETLLSTKRFSFVSCIVNKPDDHQAFAKLLEKVKKITSMSMGVAA